MKKEYFVECVFDTSDIEDIKAAIAVADIQKESDDDEIAREFGEF